MTELPELCVHWLTARIFLFSLIIFQEKLALQLSQHSPALKNLPFFLRVKYTNPYEEQHQAWKAGLRPGEMSIGEEVSVISTHTRLHQPSPFGLLPLPPPSSGPIGRDRPTSSGMSPQCKEHLGWEEDQVWS